LYSTVLYNPRLRNTPRYNTSATSSKAHTETRVN
jgi:hypothetical protein